MWEQDWVKELIKKGYKYIIKLNKGTDDDGVWATKAIMLKNGEFKMNARFDMFELFENEQYPYEDNVIVKLNG